MPVYKDEARKTWYVKYSAKDPVSGKRRQVLKRGFPTKRDAQKWETEQKASPASSTGTTFAEMDELYIAFKNPRRDSTRQQERYRVQTYMDPFKDKPIDRITKAELVRWYTDLIAREDLSVQTKNYCIYLVKGVFKFAADLYDVPNPTGHLKKIQKPERQEYYTWTPEEFRKFVSCVHNPVYAGFFTFMYYTGTRRGEAMAVRASDVDPDALTVRIEHQIKYFEEGFQTLKTGASARTLRLPENLWTEIRPLYDRCTEEAPFLFGGERSLAITSIQRYFTAGIKASGVRKIRIHDLRHSFATNAINAGCNIVAVSKYLGHSTINQTLETYTHLLEKTDEDMVKRVNDLFKK